MSEFKGQEVFSIDEKGRVSFPAKMMKYLPAKTKRTFTVLRAWDREPCLRIYPQDSWNVVASELKSRVNQFVEKQQMFLRVILGRAVELELDSAGRLCIPRNLLELASIEKQAMLVGVSDHIELWNPERYQRAHLATIDNISDIAAEVMGGSRE